MKNYKNYFNKNVVIRSSIVVIITTFVVVLIGLAVRTILLSLSANNAYTFAYRLFQLLSRLELPIFIIAILIALAVFSNWILKPIYDGVADIVKHSIHLKPNDMNVELPQDMKILEEQLIQINRDIKLWRQAAKEAEAKKDELVVYLAHDIRTPLSSTLGYLSLLDESDDLTPEQQQRFIRTALKKTESIQVLVDELFEITRYNISQVELVKEIVNVPHMIEQIVGEAYFEISEKGITVNIHSESSQKVFADIQKLSRALENIIVNAIRYTPVGETINIKTLDDDDRIVIEISNYGTTIDENKLARVFERFYRGDEARQTSSGSGLGLAIAKDIVTSHGGSIHAANKENAVVFTIKLPSIE